MCSLKKGRDGATTRPETKWKRKDKRNGNVVETIRVCKGFHSQERAEGTEGLGARREKGSALENEPVSAGTRKQP